MLIGKKVLVCSVTIIFFSLSFSSAMTSDELFLEAGIQPLQGGKKASNFRLDDLGGRKVELKHFKGKVVFLNFWATWCGPCKEEMPAMEALYNQFKDKDFVFLAISVDYAGLKTVKEFVEKYRYTFPVLMDPKGETLDRFGVKGIPTTVLIDRKGLMIGKAVGPKDWKRPEVISILNLLLEK